MDDFSSLYIEVVPKAMAVLRSQMRLEARPYLTVPQFRILANVKRGLSSINEIAKHHGVSQPAMSRMVEGLVQKGYLERARLERDRRCCALFLTSEGKKLFGRIESRARKRLKNLAKDCPKEEAELTRALKILQAFSAGSPEEKTEEKK